MITKYIADFWIKRTIRERLILAVATTLLTLGFVLPMILNPVVGLFTEQAKSLTQIKRTYEATPKILKNYAQLANRRRELEAYYKNADLSTDPLTHLERLLKNTALADSSYNITPREGAQISGGKYVHKIFKVNFKTDSYENLVAFLNAVTTGNRPMLVSYLKLDKSRFAKSGLQVEIHVSGFQSISN